MSSVDDLRGSARIRDAAIRVFGRDGFRAATVRAIAAEAGVSPALVIHHYGSKDGLREVCDRHVLATAEAEKMALLDEGAVDGDAYLAEHPHVREQLLYLTRALQEGGDLADRWFDALVEHTDAMLARLPADLVEQSADPQARTVVVVAQSLAQLVFADQIARHLGVDAGTDPAGHARVSRAVTELQVRGLFTRDPLGARDA